MALNTGKRFVLEGYTSLEGQNLKNLKFEKFKNTHYIWHEFKGWTYMWGINMSSEDMTNEMLDTFNKHGWKIKQFNMRSGYLPNLSLSTTILISMMSLMTFGFITYFSGHFVLLEKDFNSYEEGLIEKELFLSLIKEDRKKMYKKSMIIFVCCFLSLVLLIKILFMLPWAQLYFKFFV